MRRATAWALAAALLGPASAEAQEIYQAVLLDLTELAVHVTVARGRGDEQVRCFVGDGAGRGRLVGSRPLAAGLSSGGTTILTIPLPLLNPGETQFAVALMRGDTELHRTEWQPIYRPRSP